MCPLTLLRQTIFRTSAPEAGQPPLHLATSMLKYRLAAPRPAGILFTNSPRNLLVFVGSVQLGVVLDFFVNG